MILLQGKMRMKKINIMKMKTKINIINIEIINLVIIEIKIVEINMKIVIIKIINIDINPALVLAQEGDQEKNNIIKEIQVIEEIKNYIQNILQNLIQIQKNLPRKINIKIFYLLVIILSFIIKQEEEIEKENDKKQIRLYNEYLKIKEETDAKMEMKNLPNLLPVLTAKFDEDDDIYPSEDRSENGSYGKKDVIKLPYHLKRKLRTGIIRNFKLSERKNDYRQNKNINRNYQSNRYNKIIKRRDD